MIGPDLCPKCKGLHYRRDPCIVRRVANKGEAQKVERRSPKPEDAGSIPATFANPPKRGPGRPRTITDMRAYKADWQSKYRSEVAAGIRIPKRRER